MLSLYPNLSLSKIIMATLKFFLERSKKDKADFIPVYVSISCQSIRIKRAIKHVKVKEIYWKNERIKPNGKTESDNRHNEFNDILNRFEEKFNNLIRSALINQFEISIDYILKELDNESTTSEYNFFTCLSTFITLKGTDCAKRTIMGYQTCFNKLLEFQKTATRKISFNTLDLKFYDEFKYYILITQNHSDNYLAKLIANLKSFLKWANDRGFKTNNDFQKFKAPERPKEIIALYEDELMQLYKHDFTSKKLEHVRDVFCFGCFTGLRYSDIRTLRPEHIGDYMITKQCVKTKDTIKIPLSKFSLAILQKYKGNLDTKVLPIISEQKFNEYIKECCKQAKIDKKTPVLKFIGGQKIEEIKFKYELITSHVARKTFTTISLTLGMNESMVKEITNHKRDSNFRKYVSFAKNSKMKAIDFAWDKLNQL